jgi:hypothetical protein
MDISALWPVVKLVLFGTLAVGVFRLCKQVPSRWLRVSLRTMASFLVIGCAICLALLSLGTLACTKFTRPIYSPDGWHVAVLTYVLQGALGDDYARVEIRSTWSPLPKLAYSGLGTWDSRNDKRSSPEVRWLDRSRLLIRYYDDRPGHEGRGQPTCVSEAGGVQIVCENLWSSRAPYRAEPTR